MISIIHPSRNRPLQALITAKNWMAKADNQLEYILSLDKDDKDLEAYRKAFHMMNINIVVSDNRSAVDAINKGAEISKGNILIIVSDDFDCEKGWDTQIIKHTEGKTDWIAKTQDGIQPWIITLPLMDRVYYNRFGYVYHPDYRHMFADTEMSCVADITGRKITLPIKFTHNHYSVVGGKDEVNAKADNTWSQGERLFIHRAKNNFGINNPLPIQNESYRNWLRTRV